MSRIVHGPSAEVKNIRTFSRKKEASSYTTVPFMSIGLEGALSEDEIKTGLAGARAEGAREAETRLMAPLRAALENIEKILDEISQFRRELFKESEEDILELVRTVSKRVIAKEVSLNPDLMKDVVGKALTHLEKQKRISIHANPSDFEFYHKAKEDFLNKFKGIEELEIGVDPDVPKGSVNIRSKTVELDLRLDAMVDHLLTQVAAAKTEIGKTNDEGDSI
ncbi:MAG: Flagellar assembly protein FliH/Type secretion system HrpE [Bacteriovoracaceae bacterium]|nr:Flagellar assembly protein FliH/Type secretion system HrpE [Bacteriovoracaceae bacterium]